MTAAPERTRALPAYRLRFQERPGYLYAHVQGEEDSFDITRDYWLAIAGECARRGTRSLLVLDELTADPVLPSFRFSAKALFDGIAVTAERAS